MSQNKREAYQITGATRLYGIIGDPVEHSLSPLIWNSAFELVAPENVYVPFKVSANEIEEAIAGLKALNVAGINVTRPHKKAAAMLCSKLNQPADLLKAVNTIKFSNQGIEGWNTDATGFSQLLENLPNPDKALVLGSGGSSRAIIWALEQAKVKSIFQISRKKQNRPEFLNEKIEFLNFAWNSENLKNLICECEMIINTTPLGWKKEDRLFELSENLTSQKTYVDLNYQASSQLLADARKSGCRTLDGRELLLAQGASSFKLLTGIEPPTKIMRSCLF